MDISENAESLTNLDVRHLREFVEQVRQYDGAIREDILHVPENHFEYLY